MIHLYRCARWSTYRIGEVAGISRQRVARLLREAGIQLRARGAGGTKPRLRSDEPANLPELLRGWYVDSRLTSTEIAEKLRMPERTVRARMVEYGIVARSRGQFNREDRRRLHREVLDAWYTDAELPAREVAARTDTSTKVVLRNAHDLGVPVRVGGPPPRRGPTQISLIEVLYADPLVAAVVARHQLPVRPAGGQLWQRFPDPVPLTASLVDDLYTEAGIAVTHIELLTGQPSVAVMRLLHSIGTPMRSAGGRCPFLRRWRAANRAAPQPYGRRTRNDLH
jgi:hypothetical protein